MKEYTYTDNGYTFKRVNKKIARNAYKNGLRIILCPCNLRPGFPYNPEVSVSGKSTATFEEQLNAFEFYNLRNKETGRYTSFYIPIRKIDAFTGNTPTKNTLHIIEEYDYRYIGG